jgi:hypothetical protein
VHEHSNADRVPPALHTPSRLPHGPELRGSRQHDAEELPTDTDTNTMNERMTNIDAPRRQRQQRVAVAKPLILHDGESIKDPWGAHAAAV